LHDAVRILGVQNINAISNHESTGRSQTRRAWDVLARVSPILQATPACGIHFHFHICFCLAMKFMGIRSVLISLSEGEEVSRQLVLGKSLDRLSILSNGCHRLLPCPLTQCFFLSLRSSVCPLSDAGVVLGPCKPPYQALLASDRPSLKQVAYLLPSPSRATNRALSPFVFPWQLLAFWHSMPTHYYLRAHSKSFFLSLDAARLKLAHFILVPISLSARSLKSNLPWRVVQ